MSKALNKLKDLLYPPVCPLCGNLLGNSEMYICDGCRPRVSYVSSPTCFRCGKETGDEEAEYCADCSAHMRSYIRGFPAINYDAVMRDSIAAFKYHNKREYVSYFAYEIIKQHGRELMDLQPDVLVPVPVHRAKLRKRGYNQADLLAERLGGYMGIPVDADIIERGINTLPQKELGSTEREKNLKRAFISSGKIVNYKKAILVDDIYTTGATIEACTGVLHDIGIKDVYYTSICIGKGY